MRLKKRSRFLVMSSTVGTLIQILGGVLNEGVLLQCNATFILLSLVVPTITLPIPIKLLDYYNKQILAQALLDAINNESNYLAFSSGQINDEKIESTRSEAILVAWRLLTKGTVKGGRTKGKRYSKQGSIISMKSSTPQSSSLQQSDIVPIASGSTLQADLRRRRRKLEINERSLRMLRFLISTRMKALIFFLCLIPFIIVAASEYASQPFLRLDVACYRCPLTSAISYLIMIGGIAIILIGISFALLVRKYPDPFGVVSECKMVALYGGVIAMAGFILGRFIPEPLYFSTGWLVYAGAIIAQFITTDLQIYYAKRDSKEHGFGIILPNGFEVSKEYPSALDTADDGQGRATPAKLKLALEDPKEMELFEAHLVSEFAVESITMYKDCEGFKRGFFDLSESTRRARAKRIVEKHVSDNALMQVNLPFALRTKLINQVEDNDIPIDIDMFEEAEKELLGMLVGSYQRYVHSSIYKESHSSQQKD